MESKVESKPAKCLQQKKWRREWDSNPRYGFPYTRFPSVRLQPLGHPSATASAGGNIMKDSEVATGRIVKDSKVATGRIVKDSKVVTGRIVKDSEVATGGIVKES